LGDWYGFWFLDACLNFPVVGRLLLSQQLLVSD